MSLIDTEEAATRLAKAIEADIRLYNYEDVTAGADISDVLQEGRALFHSRVVPSLHRVYEETIQALVQGRPLSGAATLAPVEKASGSPLPPGLFEDKAQPKRAGPSWWFVAVALLLAVAIGWLVAQR